MKDIGEYAESDDCRYGGYVIGVKLRKQLSNLSAQTRQLTSEAWKGVTLFARYEIFCLINRFCPNRSFLLFTCTGSGHHSHDTSLRLPCTHREKDFETRTRSNPTLRRANFLLFHAICSRSVRMGRQLPSGIRLLWIHRVHVRPLRYHPAKNGVWPIRTRLLRQREPFATGRLGVF